MGTAYIVDLANGDRATRLELTGLQSNTNYVAHYHSTGSCTTPGTEIAGSEMSGMTGASATTLTLRGLSPRTGTGGVDAAKYLDVHMTNTSGTVVACVNL